MAEAKPEKSKRHPLRAAVDLLMKQPLPKPQPGRPIEQPLMLTERGAVLFVAHLAIVEGDAKVVAMDGGEILRHALLFRSTKPHAWMAMRLGDCVRTAHFQRSYPEPRPGVGDYQRLLDAILFEPPSVPRPAARAPAA